MCSGSDFSGMESACGAEYCFEDAFTLEPCNRRVVEWNFERCGSWYDGAAVPNFLYPGRCLNISCSAFFCCASEITAGHLCSCNLKERILEESASPKYISACHALLIHIVSFMMVARNKHSLRPLVEYQRLLLTVGGTRWGWNTKTRPDRERASSGSPIRWSVIDSDAIEAVEDLAWPPQWNDWNGDPVLFLS